MAQSNRSLQMSPLAKVFADPELLKNMDDNLLSLSTPTIGRIIFNHLGEMEHLVPLINLGKALSATLPSQEEILKAEELMKQKSEKALQARADGDTNQPEINSFEVFTQAITPELEAWINLACARALMDLFTLDGQLRIGIKEPIKRFRFEKHSTAEEIKAKLFAGYLQHIGAHACGDESNPAHELIVTTALDAKCKELAPDDNLIDNLISVNEIKEKVCDALLKALEDNKLKNAELVTMIRNILARIYSDELNKFYQAQEALHYFQVAKRKLGNQIIHEDENNYKSKIWDKALSLSKQINHPYDSDDIKRIYLLARVMDATASSLQDEAARNDYENLIAEVNALDDGKPLAATMLVVLTLALIVAAALTIPITGGGTIPLLFVGLFSLCALTSLSSAVYLYKKGNESEQLANKMTLFSHASAPAPAKIADVGVQNSDMVLSLSKV